MADHERASALRSLGGDSGVTEYVQACFLAVFQMLPMAAEVVCGWQSVNAAAIIAAATTSSSTSLADS